MAQGAPLAVRDVRPLPSGDELGLGVFMFLLICTICGYISPTILETLAPGLPPGRRYAVVAGTAVLIPGRSWRSSASGRSTRSPSAWARACSKRSSAHSRSSCRSRSSCS
jgi:hypothetical protein